MGARIDSKLTPNWNLRAEAAGEWGANRVNLGAPRQDISAFGFNGRLTYAFNDKLANRLHADLEYLSGDDPDTTDQRGLRPALGPLAPVERADDLPVAAGQPRRPGHQPDAR